MGAANEPEKRDAKIDDGGPALGALESAESHVAGCPGTGTPGDGGSEAFAPCVFGPIYSWRMPTKGI
jgi:hypothetical protein